MDDARRDALGQLLLRLGLTPRPEALPLVHQALVHRSWRSENAGEQDNERLEFLGDAVVGLAATQHLFARYPGSPEGELSKRRAALVSRQMLGRIAAATDIPALLLLGAGEDSSGGRERESNLGSALEAVVGACSLVYTWEELAAAITASIIEPADGLVDAAAVVDHKTPFQEWCQRVHGAPPAYEVKEVLGPDHAREFVVAAIIAEEEFSRGRGSRIRAAENDAARAGLERAMGEEGERG